MTRSFDEIAAALARPWAPSSDFDLNPDVAPPADRRLRTAAVLVPLIMRNGALNAILTKRASHLKHHPGQIAFPGGKVEDADSDVTEAALREAEEEIGLPRRIVRPIGMLAPHETVTSFTVYPVVAEVEAAFSAVPEPSEVDEIFEAPLAQVVDPARFSVQSRIWQGRPRYYHTVPYGPYYIWGATARILRGLADRLVS